MFQSLPGAGAPLTAAVLATGDEVLRGEIVNGNAAWLAARLFDGGLELREHVVVSDEPGDIRGALRRLGAFVDVIVCTGGLGPTEDDRTVDVVCDLLGVSPEVHEPSAVVMRARFERSKLTITPNNLRQVRIPAGATPLPNGAGLAPGFVVTLGRATAFFMPGVPREMNRIFDDHVGARLTELLRQAGAAPVATRTFHVYGAGESHVDDKLRGLLDGVPNATLHFRTELTENHVKVVLRGRSADAAAGELARLDEEVRRRLGDLVYGVDLDTFPGAVARALRTRQATLALAESCTGGYAGQLLTAEPGASDVFRGGVVAYANEVKTGLLGVSPATLSDHGAVSEPCAREMAEGARDRLGATFGVSITGVAGAYKDPPPEPAFEGSKQVGTVCFAVAGPAGTNATTRWFSGGRERIRRAAAYYALDLARRAAAGF